VGLSSDTPERHGALLHVDDGLLSIETIVAENDFGIVARRNEATDRA
jgi:hypothetical protein